MVPRPEPNDHALGRSRGGFTTKIDALVDHRMRPVVLRLTAGQAGDNPQLVPLLNDWSQQGSPAAAGAGSGCWPTRPTLTPRPGTSCVADGFPTPSQNALTSPGMVQISALKD